MPMSASNARRRQSVRRQLGIAPLQPVTRREGDCATILAKIKRCRGGRAQSKTPPCGTRLGDSHDRAPKKVGGMWALPPAPRNSDDRVAEALAWSAQRLHRSIAPCGNVIKQPPCRQAGAPGDDLAHATVTRGCDLVRYLHSCGVQTGVGCLTSDSSGSPCGRRAGGGRL
jgi:hypothetical protein